jgi:hypothetical protein
METIHDKIFREVHNDEKEAKLERWAIRDTNETIARKETNCHAWKAGPV